jgi:hypothetical protein
MNTTININQSLLNIVTAFSVFVGGAVALALLAGAFLIIFAGTNATQQTNGFKIIGYAILGALVGLGATTLANLIITNIK